MKVKIIVSFFDIEYGTQIPDSIVDLPKGANWIECGFAEEFKEVKATRKVKTKAVKNGN